MAQRLQSDSRIAVQVSHFPLCSLPRHFQTDRLSHFSWVRLRRAQSEDSFSFSDIAFSDTRVSFYFRWVFDLMPDWFSSHTHFFRTDYSLLHRQNRLSLQSLNVSRDRASLSSQQRLLWDYFLLSFLDFSSLADAILHTSLPENRSRRHFHSSIIATEHSICLQRASLHFICRASEMSRGMRGEWEPPSLSLSLFSLSLEHQPLGHFDFRCSFLFIHISS